jgi:glycogen synthase
MKRAMTEDVSWTKSAQRYVNLFNTAIAARREHRGLAAVVD